MIINDKDQSKCHFVYIALIFLVVISVLSCATIKRVEQQNIVLHCPINEAGKITRDYLILNYFEIERDEDLYIDGLWPSRSPESIIGRRGFFVSIWLEPINENMTKIYVDSAVRGFLGSGDQFANDLLKGLKKFSENYKLNK